MADKAWKAFERVVAKFFGCQRNSLSGGNSKVSRSDTTHSKFFIECKLHASPAIWSLYEETREKAKKEKKLPVVAVRKKNKEGFLVCVHSNNLKGFCKKYLKENGYVTVRKEVAEKVRGV